MARTLLEQVAEILPRYNMLERGAWVGVAVSGGADSAVLLRVLHALREQHGCGLTVLHVNHHLRGAESDGDEEFVRGLAEELGLPIEVEQAAAPGSDIEQAARDIRRAFFARAKEEHGLARVALGHTRDDQAETVLLRLLRGTGLTGLAGMRPVTGDGLIRPLLFCGREEVRQWAEREGVRWREDSSNADAAFTRNRLRRDILPALRTFNPNLEAVLAQMADTAQAEEDYWDGETERLFGEMSRRSRFGLHFARAAVAALPAAVKRRLLRRAVREVRGDLRRIEREHVDSVAALCDSGLGHDRVIVPGVDAIRSFDELLLTRQGFLGSQERGYRLELRVGEPCVLPFGEGVLTVDWAAGEFCANFEVCDWDADVLSPVGPPPPLWVRNWQPGDEMRRVGHQSSEKIKTMFQASKVLLWERKHWPVVEAGGEIVWTRRFGGAARAVAKATSGRVIRLRYEPGMSEHGSDNL